MIIEQHIERRQYYRIDDEVILTYRVVEAFHLENIKLPRLFHLTEQFSEISQQMKFTLSRIDAVNEDIGHYLRLLDKKLDTLAEMVLLDEVDENDEMPRYHVNLSAGGMAFPASEALHIGALLELNIILLPEMSGMMLQAKIMRISHFDDPKYPYRIAVAFQNVNPQYTDIIIKHVLNRQTEYLRKRRENRDI